MEKEKEYSLVDPESGIRYRVSKEYYESYMKMLDEILPKFRGEKLGVPIIYGTAGEFDCTKQSWMEQDEAGQLQPFHNIWQEQEKTPPFNNDHKPPQ
jgi:hypothetical protein